MLILNGDFKMNKVDSYELGVNLFKNYTKQLSFGVEVGNFEMAEASADSDYVQLTAKYVL